MANRPLGRGQTKSDSKTLIDQQQRHKNTSPRRWKLGHLPGTRPEAGKLVGECLVVES